MLLFILCTIDYLVIVDISNAFVQTDSIKHDKSVKIIIIIIRNLAEMLIGIAPETYLQYAVRDRRGNIVLYVRLLKSLYGLMESSLIFYRNS